jgi:outer membrane protein TolC
MRVTSKLLALFLQFFAFIPVISQETFDLNKCIATGLERNFSILIARNEEVIASNNYTIGNAGFLPVIESSGRYDESFNSQKKSFLEGGDTTITGLHNTSITAGVGLDWTIFRGFNALATYKKLSELKTIGELNTQLAVEDFIAEIASEYYLYIQQIQLYNNLAYAVSLSRERVRIDEERYLLGAASKLQLLQSQVYLNADSSRFARQNEVLRASQVRINRLMAIDDLGHYIVPADTSISINSNLVYDSLFSYTEHLNTSLQIARRNINISAYDYKLVASRTYPYLSLSTGYNFNMIEPVNGLFKNQQTSGLSYGLTFGVNIFNGLNQKRNRANALVERNNSEFAYQQLEQQVRADLITIYFGYQNNLVLFKLEQENLKTAEENLEIALERYKLGSLSGLELREVQQSLLEAEERLLLVQYQTKVAEISLLQISGRIMDYLVIR